MRVGVLVPLNREQSLTKTVEQAQVKFSQNVDLRGLTAEELHFAPGELPADPIKGYCLREHLEVRSGYMRLCSADLGEALPAVGR